MKKKFTGRSSAEVFSVIASLVIASAAAVPVTAADTLYYDDTYSAEVSDDGIYRPLNAVSVSGGGVIDPDSDPFMEYTILNNTPGNIMISDASAGEMQKYSEGGWKTVREADLSNLRYTELNGFEGYEDEMDVGSLPDGEYRIVIISYSSDITGMGAYSENYLEFTVRRAISAVQENTELMLPDDKLIFTVSDKAPFDIELSIDDTMSLYRFTGGKYKKLTQRGIASKYYKYCFIGEGRGSKIKLPVKTFYNLTPGNYRLTAEWTCCDVDEVPEDYEGPVSGIFEMNFTVSEAFTVECLPTAASSREEPELCLKITNNTGKKVTLRRFGRIQVKQSDGTWKYAGFKNSGISQNDIDTKLTLKAGETGSASIILTDYYDMKSLLGKQCRAEIYYGGSYFYCEFSADSGNYCIIK